MESPPLAPPQQLAELIHALEQAAQLAKQLPFTTDPSQHHLIFSALASAHLSLSSFLSLPPTADASNAAEPMQLAEEHAAAAGRNSKDSSMDGVEERMRDFNIQNKRPKRPLSPSAAAITEHRRIGDRAVERMTQSDLDSYRNMLRSLESVPRLEKFSL